MQCTSLAFTNLGYLKHKGGMREIFGVLAEHGNMGRDASEFIVDLKRFSYKALTIFYLPTTGRIFVVKVLSQRMD